MTGTDQQQTVSARAMPTAPADDRSVPSVKAPGRWSFDRKNPTHLVALAMVAGMAIHLVFAPFAGLSYNETYVAVLSRHLSLSYVDHPPLIMWLVAAMRRLTGSEADIVVRLPSMLFFLGSTWLTYQLGKSLFNAEAGAYAAIALTLSPIFSLFIGSFAVTDGPMLFFVLLSTWLLQRTLFNSSGRNASLYWLAAGFFTGLGMLAKYSAVFVPLGVGLFLLTQPAYRHWLRHPAPYLAAVIAALVFSPVIIWNAQHDWISLAFQGHRALPEGGFKPERLLAYLVVIALFTMPGIWLVLIVVLIKGLAAGPKDVPRWFLCCMALTPIVFFTLVRLVANPHDKGYHWPAPGYVMLFPLLGVAIQNWTLQHSRRIRRWLIATVATFAALMIGLVSHSLTGWIRLLAPQFAERDPLTTDHLDWTDLEIYLRQRGFLDRPDIFVAGARWQNCAKIDYALRGRVPVLCFTDEPLHLAFFENQSAVRNRDAVIVTQDTLSEMRSLLSSHFSAIEPLGSITLSQFGLPVQYVNLFWGRNFHSPFPWPYGNVAGQGAQPPSHSP